MTHLEDSGLGPTSVPPFIATDTAHQNPAASLPPGLDAMPVLEPGTARIETVLIETSLSGAIEVPDSVFNPGDAWAETMQEGLLIAIKPSDETALEVGVGTGELAILVLEHNPNIKVYASDVESVTTEVAARNLKRFQDRLGDRFIPLLGSIDVLDGVDNHPAFVGQEKVDVIYACIPQVPRPPEGTPLPPDSSAHYFDPKKARFVPKFDAYFLGLNEKLLCQARDYLNPGGRVILNLAGRVPENVLLEMFDHFEFDARIIHSKTVKQHAGTSIEELVHAEVTDGVQFTFYETPGCEGMPLSAAQAQAKLDAHCPVYHKVHVIEGTMREGVRTN